jgi:hypothetical protein
MGEAAPYNLSLALRSFNSSFDRIPAQNDMKLVDLITTAESLLGASVEISFRLSFYVAGMLAGTDRERVTIFDEMRAFYDTRNRVVHGGTLESKHRTRSITILGFVTTFADFWWVFCISPPPLRVATIPSHSGSSLTRLYRMRRNDLNFAQKWALPQTARPSKQGEQRLPPRRRGPQVRRSAKSRPRR